MASFPSSPYRRLKSNSPFTKEQASWIVLKYGELKSLTRVRRAFRLNFFRDKSRKVPDILAFKRLVQRFKESGSVRPVQTPGRAPLPPDDVRRVNQFFTEHPKAHIRLAATSLGMSFGKVWNTKKSPQVEAIPSSSVPGPVSSQQGVQAGGLSVLAHT